MNSYKEVIVECMVFPPIQFFISYLKADKITLEAKENYQKKSYRNRYVIDAPLGTLSLSIPLRNGKNSRMPISDVMISDDEDWQKKHEHAIKFNYGRTPYYDFYIDTICKLIRQEEKRLFYYNLNILDKILSLLQIDKKHEISGKYILAYDQNILDLRDKIKPGSNCSLSNYKTYDQAFGDVTEEFKSNLSILDLLFNCGPESIIYLNY